MVALAHNGLVYVPCQTQNFKITAKTIWHGIYTVLGNVYYYEKINQEIFKSREYNNYKKWRNV